MATAVSPSRFRDLIGTVFTKSPSGKYNLDRVRKEYCLHAQKVMAGRGDDGSGALSKQRVKLEGATIEGNGCTYFGERRISPSIETVDLAEQLSRLMPALGASRDDVAVDILHCIDNIICLMAGVACERLICGKALPGSDHDLIEAEALASIVVRSRSPAAVRALIDYDRCEARELIECNIGAVLAVTFALLKHRELSGGQIETIIARGRES
jgi:hypothetical protein